MDSTTTEFNPTTQKYQAMNNLISPLMGGPTIGSQLSGAQLAQVRKTETSITINEAENGRIVRCNNKLYVCAQDTPLIDVIRQALVEAQLEK